MSDLFYGKIYRYKRKIIGVCRSPEYNLFMIGYIKPTGTFQRVKDFPNLSANPDILQNVLDEFARFSNLPEVYS